MVAFQTKRPNEGSSNEGFEAAAHGEEIKLICREYCSKMTKKTDQSLNYTSIIYSGSKIALISVLRLLRFIYLFLSYLRNSERKKKNHASQKKWNSCRKMSHQMKSLCAASLPLLLSNVACLRAFAGAIILMHTAAESQLTKLLCGCRNRGAYSHEWKCAPASVWKKHWRPFRFAWAWQTGH